jgi:hypothetical protein
MRAQAKAHGRKSCLARAGAGDIAEFLRRSYSCGSPHDTSPLFYNMPMHHSQFDGCAAWVGWSVVQPIKTTQHDTLTTTEYQRCCIGRALTYQMMSCPTRIANCDLYHVPCAVVSNFTSLAAGQAPCGRFLQRFPTNLYP